MFILSVKMLLYTIDTPNTKKKKKLIENVRLCYVESKSTEIQFSLLKKKRQKLNNYKIYKQDMVIFIF